MLVSCEVVVRDRCGGFGDSMIGDTIVVVYLRVCCGVYLINRRCRGCVDGMLNFDTW